MDTTEEEKLFHHIQKTSILKEAQKNHSNSSSLLWAVALMKTQLTETRVLITC